MFKMYVQKWQNKIFLSVLNSNSTNTDSCHPLSMHENGGQENKATSRIIIAHKLSPWNPIVKFRVKTQRCNNTRL